MTSHFISPIELNLQPHQSPIRSSRHLGWNGILVEQYQNLTPTEVELPALSEHLLKVPGAVESTQHQPDLPQASIVQPDESVFIPAGQPSHWRFQGGANVPLYIYLKPRLISQIAKAIGMSHRLNLRWFSQPDMRLHQMATLFLSELKSGGIMGRLYVESLTQALVIYLLRHYSSLVQEDRSQNSRLTQSQLQQVIDYIRTHLNYELSLTKLAAVINISPTYFASLFKQTLGISPHQYVIQQRVEQAKLMLAKTDLAIADIALQVGFASQSHLNQQFKRLTGMTPKQAR
jgi:AraC family transcriptional regulator